LFSFPFLVGAYAASAVAVLWAGELSEWLLRRRRALGLAFFAVIAVHLVLIAHLLSLPPSPQPKVLGLTPGVLTYTVLAAMVLASFSRIATAMGPARARLLLRVGLHWVFAVFTLGLLKGVFIRHYYAWWLLPLMIAMAVYVVRFQAWRLASRL
jgi:sulfoxide reductase heme-binding subunit YedZ